MLMGPRARMVGLAAMLPLASSGLASHPRRCPLLEVMRTWSGLRKNVMHPADKVYVQT
jgi:hypothetical protein